MSRGDEFIKDASRAKYIELLMNTRRSGDTSLLVEVMDALCDPSTPALFHPLNFETPVEIRNNWKQQLQLRTFVFGSIMPANDLVIEWPIEIPEKAQGELWEIAYLYKVGQLLKSSRRTDRVDRDIRKLISLLSDPAIVAILDENIGYMNHLPFTLTLMRALGYDRFSPERPLNYRSPEPGPMDLALAVCGVLREHGMHPDESRTGILVRTIEAIRKATGTKTNSLETARELFNFPKKSTTGDDAPLGILSEPAIFPNQTD